MLRFAELIRFPFDPLQQWHVWRLFDGFGPPNSDPNAAVMFVAVTGADPAIGDIYDPLTGTFSPGTLPPPPPPPPPPEAPKPPLTALGFWRRFTTTERVAFETAKASDARLRILERDLTLMAEVDVEGDQSLRGDVQYLLTAGVLANQGRVNAVLAKP